VGNAERDDGDLWEEFRACLHLSKLILQSRMRLPVISSSRRSGIKNRSNERLQEPIAGCALHAKNESVLDLTASGLRSTFPASVSALRF
jgi:hypothetical protein